MSGAASTLSALIALLTPSVGCGAPGHDDLARPKDSHARFSGIWAAPSVLVSDGPSGAQFFDVHGRHRVAVLPLPRGLHGAARKELERCATGWREIYSHAGDTAANAYACYWSSGAAEAALNTLSHDVDVSHVLRAAFNITGQCRTMLNWPYALHGFRRSWVTALHTSMPADVHHADGCDTYSRPAGHDFFTAISWPHDRWEAAWGGNLEFAAQECGGPADSNREVSVRTPPALTVAPAPDRLVIFSGPLVHRATQPSRQMPRSAPPGTLGAEYPRLAAVEGWRFSAVQQLTCPTGRDPGPYVADLRSRQWLVHFGVSVAVFALCICASDARAAGTARAAARGCDQPDGLRRARANRGDKG